MSTLLHILRFPVLVFFVNVLFDGGGIYAAVLWLDMPMHFLGGVSIAVAGAALLEILSPFGGSPAGRKTRGFVNELPFLVRMLFIMSFVGLAAVGWELWEFSIDFVLEKNLQGDLFDTMTDMFFGLLGGFVTLIAWLFRKKREGTLRY